MDFRILQVSLKVLPMGSGVEGMLLRGGGWGKRCKGQDGAQESRGQDVGPSFLTAVSESVWD